MEYFKLEAAREAQVRFYERFGDNVPDAETFRQWLQGLPGLMEASLVVAFSRGLTSWMGDTLLVKTGEFLRGEADDLCPVCEGSGVVPCRSCMAEFSD